MSRLWLPDTQELRERSLEQYELQLQTDIERLMRRGGVDMGRGAPSGATTDPIVDDPCHCGATTTFSFTLSGITIVSNRPETTCQCAQMNRAWSLARVANPTTAQYPPIIGGLSPNGCHWCVSYPSSCTFGSTQYVAMGASMRTDVFGFNLTFAFQRTSLVWDIQAYYGYTAGSPPVDVAWNCNGSFTIHRINATQCLATSFPLDITMTGSTP